MSNTKTGLLYSELTGTVYWGTINAKTGIARGHKKDVTSDFIGIMLQKFPVGHRQNIVCNGELEAVIYVVDEKVSHRLNASKEMLEEIERDIAEIESRLQFADSRTLTTNPDVKRLERKKLLLAKARGESQ